jgi:peptidoglycan-associated lipoprotein
MTTMYRGFAAGLAMVTVLLVPACRTTKKPTTTTTTTTAATTNTVPDIPITTTTAEPVVQEPRDFVRTDPQVSEEQLPRDIEQLNRVAQERGFIRDAFFNYDEFTLDADAQAALTATANWLRSNAGYNLLIEGHCDERGTEQYNLALGDRRANIAREFLMTLGIDSSRIRTVSYGEERPFDEGHDDNAWAKNRRAHLVLVR